jgi:hypothetical protein
MTSYFSGPRAYPYLTTRLTDLPNNLRNLAEQKLARGEPIHTIFVVPPQTMLKNFEGRGGTHSVPEQALLFTADGVLHVQAAKTLELPGQAAYIRCDQLLYARLILILLYGRLELCGVEDAALKHISVEYNTVAHRLLQTELHRFLRLACGTAIHTHEPGENLTDALVQKLWSQSFKFGNGLKDYALQPDERFLGYVFQSRIVQKTWWIFQRLLVPATLLAITDNELILMEEGRTSATSYGFFITFCPRAYVKGVETRPDGEWQDVYVHLEKGGGTTDHQVTIEKNKAQAWLSLWSDLNQ